MHGKLYIQNVVTSERWKRHDKGDTEASMVLVILLKMLSVYMYLFYYSSHLLMS